MSGLPANVPYTQNPRALYKWIPYLGEAETKIVFALFELTYGEGRGQGVRLFCADLQVATGLSNRAVRAAVKTLSERGAIRYKPGKNTRSAGAYQVLIGWKPCPIPAVKAVIENQPKTDKSHLNTGSKSRDSDTGSKSRDIPAVKAVMLNTISKTKDKTPPVLRTAPKGAECVVWKCDRFDALWANYPKKVGKKPARSAWNKLKPDDALCDRLDAYVAAAAVTDKWRRGFAPHLATVLNGELWTDDVAAYDRVDHPPRGSPQRSAHDGRTLNDMAAETARWLREGG